MAFNGSRVPVIRRAILLMAIGLFGGLASLDAQSTMTILADQLENTISRHIYGQFSEHLGTGMYGGLRVGEDSSIPNTDGFRNDVVEALRELEIPNIRWPGGCFADEYHWRDGVGPRENRKRMVNTHWGGVVENNHFGTHEFMLLCEMLEIGRASCRERAYGGGGARAVTDTAGREEARG